MSVTITSTVRGSIRMRSVDSGLPPDPWEVWTRDNFAGNLPTVSSNTNDSRAVEASYSVVGGSTTTVTGECRRYYMTFNTSAITSNVLSAELYITRTPSAGSNGSFIPVKSTATTLSGANYNAIQNYRTGNAMNANSTTPPLAPDVIDYADTPTFGLGTGTNVITLNATACADINTLTQFNLALVNYNYDYLYQSPMPNVSETNGINALTNPPYLVVTTGVGQWVLSIDPPAYANVNSVPKANIEFVNRIGSYPLYATIGSASAFPSNAACNLTFSGTNPIYCIHSQGSIVIGDFIYTDSAMTTPFIGGDLYYGIWDIIGSPSWWGDVYQISNTGQVTAISNCSW